MESNIALLRRSALYDFHRARGIHLTVRAGWIHPYEDTRDDENERINQNDTVLVDASPAIKWDMQGAGSAQWLAVNLPETIGIEAGDIRCALPGVCACLARDVFTLRLLPDENAFASLIAGASSTGDVYAIDVTSLFTNIAILGRQATTVLSRLTSLDFRRLDGPRALTAALARVRTRLLHLPLEGGAQLIELSVERSYAQYVWDALLDAGADMGLKVAGLNAWERVAGRLQEANNAASS